MNLLQKIAILNYINKNKDKVEYNFSYNTDNSTGIHNVEINNKGLVAVSMHRNNEGDTFCMEYNFRENNKSSYKIVKPCQQSLFDTFFISRMYSKMFSNYVKLHGMPNNSHTH